MNIKLRQLEGFVAVARLGSFTAAARELAMTQPAFSQLVRQLEDALGVRLFERTTRHVELTDAGQRFLAMVQRPLEDLGEAHDFIRDMAMVRRGRIVFASLPSVACALAIGALGRFKAAYPQTQVRLYEDQNRGIVEKVLAREVDFGIGTLATPQPDLEFRPLIVDELVAVFPSTHRLALKRTIPWKDLVREPLVLLTAGSSVRSLVEQQLAVQGLRVEPGYEVAGISTALALVRAGLGVTVRPLIALEPRLMEGLASARLAPPRAKRRIGVITRQGRALSPASQAYLGLLFAEAQAYGRARLGVPSAAARA